MTAARLGDVPLRGFMASHSDPPDRVLLVAVQCKVPGPKSRMLSDCGAGAVPWAKATKFSQVGESEIALCPALTAKFRFTTAVCEPLMVRMTIEPEYVPGARPLGSALKGIAAG